MDSKSVSGTGPLVFNDVTAECKGLHAQILPNATKLIRLSVTMKRDKDSKLSAKEFLSGWIRHLKKNPKTHKQRKVAQCFQRENTAFGDVHGFWTAMDFHSSTKNNTNV